MSRELLEFSNQIDEQFDMEAIEPDDFWQMIINMFIWLPGFIAPDGLLPAIAMLFLCTSKPAAVCRPNISTFQLYNI